MAKKLVLDRGISLLATSSSRVNVPTGELWKVTSTDGIEYNGSIELSSQTSHLIWGGQLSGRTPLGTRITGIAFKIVEV